jgi:hypothetical protein
MLKAIAFLGLLILILVTTGCPDYSHLRPVPDYSNMRDGGAETEAAPSDDNRVPE